MEYQVPVEKNDDPQNVKNQDVVNSVLSSFHDLNLDENADFVLDQKNEVILNLVQQIDDHQKDELILNLVHQIDDHERQVKEQKEWALQKALQAASKFHNDSKELVKLRKEREETLRQEQTLNMKSLSEMENTVRKRSDERDHITSTVRKLETENAEIRADIEAYKLSSSESDKTCLEVVKREKKCRKRLLAFDKQKSKLKEEIAAEKQKISELKQQLVQIEAAQKEAEANWRQEQRDKELASAQLKEAKHIKEAVEDSYIRKFEALHLKLDLDFKRHKDDLQRYQHELSLLKAARSNEPRSQSSNQSTGNSGRESPKGGTVGRLLNELDEHEKSSEKIVFHNRQCIKCKKNEASVVFLPCAHQVLCISCNDNFRDRGKTRCPSCGTPIEQSIRVFAPSS